MARGFADLSSFHEISLENVETACERFDEFPMGSYDVLNSC